MTNGRGGCGCLDGRGMLYRFGQDFGGFGDHFAGCGDGGDVVGHDDGLFR